MGIVPTNRSAGCTPIGSAAIALAGKLSIKVNGTPWSFAECPSIIDQSKIPAFLIDRANVSHYRQEGTKISGYPQSLARNIHVKRTSIVCDISQHFLILIKALWRDECQQDILGGLLKVKSPIVPCHPLNDSELGFTNVGEACRPDDSYLFVSQAGQLYFC